VHMPSLRGAGRDLGRFSQVGAYIEVVVPLVRFVPRRLSRIDVDAWAASEWRAVSLEMPRRQSGAVLSSGRGRRFWEPANETASRG